MADPSKSELLRSMNENTRVTLKSLIHNSNPGSILVGVLMYAIGAGIALRSGNHINWTAFLIGQACVILFQLSADYLVVYNGLLLHQPHRKGPDPIKEPDAQVELRFAQSFYLLAALSTLTIGVILTILLGTKGLLTPATTLILGLMVILSYLYGMPPLKLAVSGYGELTMAIILVNLTPALGALLQGQIIWQSLTLMTFPLTLLYLAMILATSLETYLQDIKLGKNTMMIRLGWQRGIFLHNVLILIAYLLIALASVSGIAWSLSWPRLLTLPVALFQISLIWKINQGRKPSWQLLKVTAYATFGVTAYFQVFSLWIGSING